MSDRASDQDLLDSWATTRCEASFHALVRRHRGLVRGMAWRWTGDPSLAEEISQRVFSRLALKAAKITAHPSLAPWLLHCARCETKSVLRREIAHRRHLKDYSHHLVCSGDASTPKLQALSAILEELLQKLPLLDRQILLLRFYEGRNLHEIAAALGKSEPAVRKQGQRALRKLARRMRSHGVVLAPAGAAAALSALWSAPVRAAELAEPFAVEACAGTSLQPLIQTFLSIMNTKTKTALITAACMTLPLAWQWHRTVALERALAESLRRPDSVHSDSRETAVPRFLAGQPAATRAILAANPDELTPHSAADWTSALQCPDPLERSRQLAALLASLTLESAPGAEKVFRQLRGSLDGGQFDTEHRMFLRAWGKLDGAAALAACRDEEGNVLSSGETLAALAGWAQTEPSRARAWLEALDPGDVQNGLTLGLIDGWSLTDFDAAARFASALPPGPVQDQFRPLLLQRALAAGGIPAAQRWFTSIPDDNTYPAHKQQAFDELIAAIMQRDPSAAAEWITSLGSQPYMDGKALPETALRLAASSPVEALRWLETIGSGEDKASPGIAGAYGNVLDLWTQQDPEAAGTWLRAQDSHPAYDQLAAAYARGVAAVDQEAALAWTDTISDEAARQAARTETARAMLRSHGETAWPALRDAGFSEEEIQQETSGMNALTIKLDHLLVARSWDVAAQPTAFFAPSGDEIVIQTLQNQASPAPPNPACHHAFSGSAAVNCASCHQ